MTSLHDGIQSVPLPYDSDRATDVLQRVDASLATGPLGDLLTGAAGSSPYLARLMTRHGDWLAEVSARPADAVLQDLLNDLHDLKT